MPQLLLQQRRYANGPLQRRYANSPLPPRPCNSRPAKKRSWQGAPVTLPSPLLPPSFSFLALIMQTHQQRNLRIFSLLSSERQPR
jgi:hypothetical protein